MPLRLAYAMAEPYNVASRLSTRVRVTIPQKLLPLVQAYTCASAHTFYRWLKTKLSGSKIMSGHSKWAQIRRSKGVNDARRGQLFTRLGREIVVAVREGGGGDPDANFRLRMAVQRARDANMPLDNIERTIKRAQGGSEGL